MRIPGAETSRGPYIFKPRLNAIAANTHFVRSLAFASETTKPKKLFDFNHRGGSRCPHRDCRTGISRRDGAIHFVRIPEPFRDWYQSKRHELARTVVLRGSQRADFQFAPGAREKEHSGLLVTPRGRPVCRFVLYALALGRGPRVGARGIWRRRG